MQTQGLMFIVCSSTLNIDQTISEAVLRHIQLAERDSWSLYQLWHFNTAPNQHIAMFSQTYTALTECLALTTLRTFLTYLLYSFTSDY